MIRVRQGRKPQDFEQRVGKPGRAWLLANPPIPGQELPPYWRRCSSELRAAYRGVCAYYGCHVAEVTGAGTTDHFVAKSGARSRAYSWGNYRFACSRMNVRKADASDVLDPFKLTDGWFVLDFVLMTVHPAPTLTAPQRRKVMETRDRLELNEGACCRERRQIWLRYQRGGAAQDLWEGSPFIALEAVRQGLLRPTDAHVNAAMIRAWLDA